MKKRKFANGFHDPIGACRRWVENNYDKGQEV